MNNIVKVAALAATLSVAAQTQAADFALVTEAGLAGVGAQVEMGFSRYLSVSGGYTALQYGLSNVETQEATYDADIDLKNPQLWLNWSPFGGGFRLSAGLVKQASSIDLVAYSIKDQANVSQVNANVDFPESWAPALTLGWQSALAEKGLGWRAIVGAMYVGEPEAQVDIQCGILVNSTTCFGLERDEERSLEAELRQYRFLPIAQLGLIYRL